MGVLQEGDILQKYRIERKVAKGGMGWLFKAEHITLKMPVAVKVLLPHHADDPNLRGRFLNEARIQCRLKHPYIIQVTDTIEVEDQLGIVMEWVEGGDLLEYMQRQGELLSYQQIHAVFGPVLEALQYAHEKGVVHRDIKPDNILLQSDGGLIPKLSDFGLAKVEDGLSNNWTKDGEALGSIRYMAPEQIRNTRMVDHRADIYSLGIVLFFMATGSFPFMGTPQELLYHHICQSPPRPQERNPAISFQFEDVILCCLQKDPENRFQSCAELAAALAEVGLEYPSDVKEPLMAPAQRLRHQRLTAHADPSQRLPLRTERANGVADPDMTAAVRKAPAQPPTPAASESTRTLSPDNRAPIPQRPLTPPNPPPPLASSAERPPARPLNPSGPPTLPAGANSPFSPAARAKGPTTTPMATPLMVPPQPPPPPPRTKPSMPPPPPMAPPAMFPPLELAPGVNTQAGLPDTRPMAGSQVPAPSRHAAPTNTPHPGRPQAGRPLLPPTPHDFDPSSYFDDDDDDAATVLNYNPALPQPPATIPHDDDDDDATFIK